MLTAFSCLSTMGTYLRSPASSLSTPQDAHTSNLDSECMYLTPRGSSVMTPSDAHFVHNLSLLESEEPAPPAAVVVCIKHRRLSYSRCCCAGGLTPHVKAPPVPFSWDAYAAGAVVRGACTPSSVVGSDAPDAHPLFTTRHCFSASNLDIVPHESCFIIPPGAFGAAAAVRCTRHLVGKVVCTDAAGRSFPFTTCRYLNRRSLHPRPRSWSV